MKSIATKPQNLLRAIFSFNTQKAASNPDTVATENQSAPEAQSETKAAENLDLDNPCKALGADISVAESSNQASTESCIPQHSKTLKMIQLVAEPAKISHFYSKNSNYRSLPTSNVQVLLGNDEVIAGLDDPAEGRSLTPESLSSVTNASVQLPSTPIELNWIIENPLDIKDLELSYTLVEANGNIQPQTKSLYSISADNNQVLTEDKLVVTGCRFFADQLVCEDVPTKAIAPGEYRFTLKAIMADTSKQENITFEADPIIIRSPHPKIVSFKVNGQEASEYPQQVHMLNPTIGSVEVMVEWEVANPDQVNVELLPTPGLVASPASMPYFVLEGNTVLTLQVTNEAGEIDKQSVTISAAPAPAPRPRAVMPLSPRLPSIPVNPVPGVPLPVPPTTVQPEQPAIPEPLQVPPSGR